MGVTVAVLYVDGVVAQTEAAAWSALRADGVDRVTVTNASGPTVLQGHSAYWLYLEGDTWVAGCASFGYSVTPCEVLLLADGTQATRPILYVPDLAHDAVKLGAWRPGEERPPWLAPTS